VRKCEACGRERAHFGLVVGARAPGEPACRWCRGCAKQHPGAVDSRAKKVRGGGRAAAATATATAAAAPCSRRRWARSGRSGASVRAGRLHHELSVNSVG
jgi:hypothetical protein